MNSASACKRRQPGRERPTGESAVESGFVGSRGEPIDDSDGRRGGLHQRAEWTCDRRASFGSCRSKSGSRCSGADPSRRGKVWIQRRSHFFEAAVVAAADVGTDPEMTFCSLPAYKQVTQCTTFFLTLSFKIQVHIFVQRTDSLYW